MSIREKTALKVEQIEKDEVKRKMKILNEVERLAHEERKRIAEERRQQVLLAQSNA